MELLANPQIWIAFATLTALELVLGIDNIIFIAILVDKLAREKRELARRIGLFMAMFTRIGLLLVLAWITGLVEPLFAVFGQAFSGRSLILIAGGLFLIWKSTGEIHQALEGREGHGANAVKATFAAVILQIMVVDLVFSLDSIITAVGMVDEVKVMIAAVIASVALMMLFAGVSCQDRCHFFQAAIFRRTLSSRTGLSHMTSGRSQLRVAPDQRSGWACLACS